MAQITCDLPYPPSVNRYYRHVGPRVLISREGRKFRMMVVSRMAGVEKLNGRIGMYGEFYPPDNRRRDLDNTLKALDDALQAAGLFNDDSQIKDLHIRMLDPIPPDGFVHVELTELDTQKGDGDVQPEILSAESGRCRLRTSAKER